MQNLIKPTNPIPKTDSFQLFLLYNGLQGKFNWDNQEHLSLLEQWRKEVITYEEGKPMPIAPTNGSFNHY